MLAGASRRRRPVFSGGLSNYSLFHFHFFGEMIFFPFLGRVIFGGTFSLFGQGEGHFLCLVTFSFSPGGGGRVTLGRGKKGLYGRAICPAGHN